MHEYKTHSQSSYTIAIITGEGSMDEQIRAQLLTRCSQPQSMDRNYGNSV